MSSYNTRQISKWPCRCDTCGHERRITIEYRSYFDTMDGGDYLDYNECLLCTAQNIMYARVRKINKFFRRVRFATKLLIASKQPKLWKVCWRLAK